MSLTNLWVERYRPKTVDEYVFTDPKLKETVSEWIATGQIGNIILSGGPGTGKTTLAKVIVNELGISEYDFMQVNASRTNSVEDVRDKITNFVQMIPFGSFKVVLLDECLHEDTLVVVKRDGNEVSIPIKDLNEEMDLVKSYDLDKQSIVWKSFQLFDKGEQPVIELEFEDGNKVVCTHDHKWYVADEAGNPKVVKAAELCDYGHILTIFMKKLKIVSITELENPCRVYDISVEDTHNFIIKDKTEVLTHNCDFLSTNAQAALRGVFEAYHMNARFILTCNYKNRLIAPLHSRCQHIQIEKPDITEFTARVATILMTENVEFDLDTLDTYVRSTYPDLRKCINNLQMNSLKGKLQAPDSSENESTDYRIAVFDLFKKGKIGEARKLLCDQARPEEMEEIYTWMYKNIQYFGANEQQQDNAVLIIKQGLVDHTICADSEINLSASLIRLARNME